MNVYIIAPTPSPSTYSNDNYSSHTNSEIKLQVHSWEVTESISFV